MPGDVARAWKQRLQVKDPESAAAERAAFRQCQTAVRAFYLDLSQWALDEPSRWAQWAVPHSCFKIVLGPALAVPGLPGRDVVSRSGIGSADLIMK